MALLPNTVSLLRMIVTLSLEEAAQALGAFSGNALTVSHANVRAADLEEIMCLVPQAEEPIFGAHFALSGAIDGSILALFHWRDSQLLLETVLGGCSERFDALDPMELSVLAEASNILVSAFLCQLEQQCNVEITLHPPAVAVEMASAVVSAAVMPIVEAEGELLLIDALLTPRRTCGQAAACHLFFLPTQSTWTQLLGPFPTHRTMAAVGRG